MQWPKTAPTSHVLGPGANFSPHLGNGQGDRPCPSSLPLGGANFTWWEGGLPTPPRLGGGGCFYKGEGVGMGWDGMPYHCAF